MNFTKITLFFLLIIFTFSTPVTAIIEVDSDDYTTVSIYSNLSYDYSALYQVQFIELTHVWSNYTGFTMYDYFSSGSWNTYYKTSLPTHINIDFSTYSGLYTYSATSTEIRSGLPENYGFTSNFNVNYSGYKIGGGSVSVWQDEEGYIHQYYTFSDRWNYSFTSTHQQLTAMNLVFDSEDFGSIPQITLHNIPYSNPAWKNVATHVSLEDIYIGSTNTNARYSGLGNQPMLYNASVTFRFDFVQNLEYVYNDISELGTIALKRTVGEYESTGSRLGISSDIYSVNNESVNNYSIFTDYQNINTSYTIDRMDGLMFDLYTTPELDYPTTSWILNMVGSGDSGYYANYTAPPDIPDVPDIPEPHDPPNYPDDPPNATSINQTINTSWSGTYYNVVDYSIGTLFSPMYNFTYWLLTPVNSLTTSINNYGVFMEDSFSDTSSEIDIVSESVSIVINGIHSKVQALITYYLVWLVLLIIMRKR